MKSKKRDKTRRNATRNHDDNCFDNSPFVSNSLSNVEPESGVEAIMFFCKANFTVNHTLQQLVHPFQPIALPPVTRPFRSIALPPVNRPFQTLELPPVSHPFRPTALPAMNRPFQPLKLPHVSHPFRSTALPLVNRPFQTLELPHVSRPFPPIALPPVSHPFRPIALPPVSHPFRPIVLPPVSHPFRPIALPPVSHPFRPIALPPVSHPFQPIALPPVSHPFRPSHCLPDRIRKPPGIVVKMIRSMDVEALLQKRRVKSNRNILDIDLKSAPAEVVYVNECLSPARRQLHAALQMKKKKGYSYLWKRGRKTEK
ncbi:hypothetical protein J6590_052378 [Homalodisca vitripennis]|nr:hypothetical protein J6590_052378 [Homalodisca vitripennis]